MLQLVKISVIQMTQQKIPRDSSISVNAISRPFQGLLLVPRFGFRSGKESYINEEIQELLVGMNEEWEGNVFPNHLGSTKMGSKKNLNHMPWIGETEWQGHEPRQENVCITNRIAFGTTPVVCIRQFGAHWLNRNRPFKLECYHFSLVAPNEEWLHRGRLGLDDCADAEGRKAGVSWRRAQVGVKRVEPRTGTCPDYSRNRAQGKGENACATVTRHDMKKQPKPRARHPQKTVDKLQNREPDSDAIAAIACMRRCRNIEEIREKFSRPHRVREFQALHAKDHTVAPLLAGPVIVGVAASRYTLMPSLT
ncbi:uncharacterized protein BDR25DRAFT_396728 [Lindgomyces ingoldianus]|uniref:Uncharacterized protein n=1 Tax=Lindgomyces ingoldianus TaxID=673940 RepID=A0ACB6QC65_9PLEO|nr:uncharacterized protein BDR25DRAFT_396728 [Lindgomyces ingoldianus]KAF2464506.1 hypothetical protein BDR25DRAFT_396728 [Lindgomyces ingoldianus]